MLNSYPKNAYIFILCPPYSGSTVLWKLVATASSVSSLPSEGQFIPEVMEQMRQNPWDYQVKLPWERIKNVWDSKWDLSKPFLIEKSPPNLIRSKEIEEHFQPVHFIIMVRNPYAHCEGLIRRNGWDANTAAEFSAARLQDQVENAKRLSGAVRFTYESLVATPFEVVRKIETAIPQLGKLDTNAQFVTQAIDGVRKRGLVDFNEQKIENLSASQIETINRVLSKIPDVMKFWGYEPIIR